MAQNVSYRVSNQVSHRIALVLYVRTVLYRSGERGCILDLGKESLWRRIDSARADRVCISVSTEDYIPVCKYSVPHSASCFLSVLEIKIRPK